MLNFGAREKAIESLKKSCAQHESLRSCVEHLSIDLFEQKQKAADEAIKQVEILINNLANSPKEFDRAIAECRMEVQRFHQTVQDLKLKAAQTDKIGATSGAAGVAAGVGVAAFAPTAAMAIATTFGTASTGTAISALSGAAATNAALAWLGGGALAAGGGGMAAGNALLAMAGPVGWTIGGVALVGSGIYLHASNAKVAEEAAQKRIKVEAEIFSLKTASSKIEQMLKFLRDLLNKCLGELFYLQNEAPENYQRFTQEQKERLGILVNSTRSLSQLLNVQVTL